MSVAVLVQTSRVSSLNEEEIVNQRITIVRSADYIFVLKEVLGGVGADAVLVQTSRVSSLNEEEIVNQRIPIS